jgi:ABC-2 type transport system permease protein
MRLFLSVFGIRFKTGLQYRVAAFAAMGTQFFFGFMFIMIYRAFYKNAAVFPGMSLEQLVSYLWLNQAFLYWVAIWVQDRETINIIQTGGVAYELARPVSLYALWFAKFVGQRVSGTLLRFIPIIAIAFFLPDGYRLLPPASALSFLIFCLSLILGLVIVVSFTLLVYMSGFYTISVNGFISFALFFSDIFTGQYVPLALMPANLRPVFYALPFAYISDFPFRVYTGSAALPEAARGLLIQTAWAAALPLLGYFILNKALKRAVVQGG